MGSTMLELYIQIVYALSIYGPLSLEELVLYVDVDLNWLTEHSALLVEQGLVRKVTNQPKTYSITDRGTQILNFFKTKM